MSTWVILLEAARNDTGAITVGELTALCEVLERGRHGGVLQCADRYALQISGTGAGPVEALVDAVERWGVAVRQLDLPTWTLVRTEVFTPEDLEREIQQAHMDEVVARTDPRHVPEEHDEIGHELLHRAFSDPLTGLLGRQAFVHGLEVTPEESGRQRAVVCLDLDGFEAVNDRFGWTTGDVALIALAQRLGTALRRGDLLARVGGDRYGVLLPETTGEAALAVAERLLDTVRPSMNIAGHDLSLSARAGVAVSLPGEPPAALLDNAEAALGAAKANGDRRPLLYGSDLSQPLPGDQDLVPAVLQDRLAHLQLMQQAAVVAHESDTLDEAALVIMRHICAQVGCVIGNLSVMPGVAEGRPDAPLWYSANDGGPADVREAAEQLLGGPGAGLVGRVLTTGRPAWNAASADDERARLRARAAGLESAFAFPVVVGPETVAVLAFFSSTRIERTESFVDLVAGIGIQLGRVVERQRAVEALRRSAEQLQASEARLREAEALASSASRQLDLR